MTMSWSWLEFGSADVNGVAVRTCGCAGYISRWTIAFLNLDLGPGGCG